MTLDGTTYMLEVDCSSFGVSCIARKAEGGESTVTCGHQGDPWPPVISCNGENLFAGGYPLVDCAAYQATCWLEGYPYLPCTGTGAGCEESEFTDECSGDSVVVCGGKHVNVFDCVKATGGRRKCEAFYLEQADRPHRVGGGVDSLGIEGAPRGCAPAGSECEEGFSACDGKTLRLCPDGFELRIDCGKWGFEGCGEAEKHDSFICNGWPKAPAGSCEKLAEACRAPSGDVIAGGYCPSGIADHPERYEEWLCAWKLDACRASGHCEQ
jgi:hypothetical protein